MAEEKLINRDDNKQPDLVYRKQSTTVSGIRPQTVDDANRSIEAVAATEDPALVYDPSRYEVVEEVLLMSGAEIESGMSIPLTIEHERHAAAVIGSFRDLAVEGDKLVGRVYFASDSESVKYYNRVNDGHLRHFSVSYPASDRESVYIPDGERATVQGREFTGPKLITTRWKPKSLGVVIYPADENAKSRSLHDDKKETKKMNEKLRKFLERCGLSQGATEAEAYEFLAGLNPDTVRSALDVQDKKAHEKDADRKAQDDAKPDPEKIRADATREAVERASEIIAMCETFEIDTKDRNEFLKSEKPLDQIRTEVMRRLAETKKDPQTPARPQFDVVLDEKDKFRAAAEGAMLIRSGVQNVDREKLATGATELSGYTMLELARHSLKLAGQSTHGNVLDVVGRAMTTSDFPYLLANVANKSLWLGWEGAEETWQQWCDTGSVSDFKTHYSPRVSEFSDLDEIQEMEEYEYGKRTEAQETYQIATYGKLGAISRQTIINDDLNAITRNMMGMGEAASRKIGDLPYAVLTGNSSMGDGTALFHADHSNYVADTSGDVPSIATISAAELAMGTQTDLAGNRRLNIKPRFFIAPYALRGTAEVFFRSERFADSDTVATDSSLAATRVNPYSGDYLIRVYESRLDDNDSATWYLAARKGRTVTVYFLNGVQAPYFETKNGWTVDGTEFKVRIDAGAKAMDYRGLYMNDGN